MRRTFYLLISLAFFAPTLGLAQGTKKTSDLKAEKISENLYKKDSLTHWEKIQHIKSHMNRLQTVPVLDREQFKLDIGPAQFQITIPFR